jgi:hypothetical protein
MQTYFVRHMDPGPRDGATAIVTAASAVDAIYAANRRWGAKLGDCEDREVYEVSVSAPRTFAYEDGAIIELEHMAVRA